MSPAQAVVPVERYIGSCLISSVAYNNNNNNNNNNKKDARFRYAQLTSCLPDYYQTPGWGAVPLVGSPSQQQQQLVAVAAAAAAAAASRRPSVPLHSSKKDKEERSPLSRLAIHTQGAPLIQTQRQTNRKNNKPPVAQKAAVSSGAAATPQTQEESPNENSLPRIIKPRKRRKKDRKPQTAIPESTIVTLKPYTPLCQEFNETEEGKAAAAAAAAAKAKAEADSKFASPSSISTIQIEPAPRQPQQQQRPEPNSNCCCRYCDPACSLWDSPVLSPTDGSNRTSMAEWSTLQVSSEIVTSPNGHRDIEIKFFSSPPPQSAQIPPQRPVSVTPPWQ